ncbi:hypothetical protein HELRODRAFT_174576 [Helobdella robusta]|uniref:Citrate transporter-like domain-containing protein n=1 Tax=Helobdella robusta TaxID=6412 RepID=T1F897_HELRO|nr:hypothetical protein HELRODRAFT_174576 [Helobdella robusta]ESO01618.1 hypothetical protein HELRODRAFT_174576 [Helobdella robusta]
MGLWNEKQTSANKTTSPLTDQPNAQQQPQQPQQPQQLQQPQQQLSRRSTASHDVFPSFISMATQTSSRDQEVSNRQPNSQSATVNPPSFLAAASHILDNEKLQKQNKQLRTRLNPTTTQTTPGTASTTVSKESNHSNTSQPRQSLIPMGYFRSVLLEILLYRKMILVFFFPLIYLPIPIFYPDIVSFGYCMFRSYWTTEALPLAVAGLLPCILMPLLSVVKIEELAMEYIKDSSLMFYGGLIIAVAIEKCNLHKRLAMAVLLIVGTSARWVAFGFMATSWFLSMWMNNTATATMMVPLVSALIGQLKNSRKKKLQNIGTELLKIAVQKPFPDGRPRHYRISNVIKSVSLPPSDIRQKGKRASSLNFSQTSEDNASTRKVKSENIVNKGNNMNYNNNSINNNINNNDNINNNTNINSNKNNINNTNINNNNININDNINNNNSINKNSNYNSVNRSCIETSTVDHNHSANANCDDINTMMMTNSINEFNYKDSVIKSSYSSNDDMKSCSCPYYDRDINYSLFGNCFSFNFQKIFSDIKNVITKNNSSNNNNNININNSRNNNSISNNNNNIKYTRYPVQFLNNNTSKKIPENGITSTETNTTSFTNLDCQQKLRDKNSIEGNNYSNIGAESVSTRSNVSLSSASSSIGSCYKHCDHIETRCTQRSSQCNSVNDVLSYVRGDGCKNNCTDNNNNDVMYNNINNNNNNSSNSNNNNNDDKGRNSKASNRSEKLNKTSQKLPKKPTFATKIKNLFTKKDDEKFRKTLQERQMKLEQQLHMQQHILQQRQRSQTPSVTNLQDIQTQPALFQVSKFDEERKRSRRGDQVYFDLTQSDLMNAVKNDLVIKQSSKKPPKFSLFDSNYLRKSSVTTDGSLKKLFKISFRSEPGRTVGQRPRYQHEITENMDKDGNFVIPPQNDVENMINDNDGGRRKIAWLQRQNFQKEIKERTKKDEKDDNKNDDDEYTDDDNAGKMKANTRRTSADM